MTMTSPKHAVFSQIRLSVPDTMDKEKYYHVKHYCTHTSQRKKSHYAENSNAVMRPV
jgi:hypothetical protein